MANINLVTADKVEVVESIEQMTLIAAEAITAGAPMRLDTSTGKFTNGNGSSSGEARAKWIATKTVATGMPVTGIKRGVMDGFDLASLNYDADLYLSDTDGRIADAAGTVSTVIGRVIPAAGQTLVTGLDKVLLVNL